MSVRSCFRVLFVAGGLVSSSLLAIPLLAQDAPVDYWPMKVGSTWTLATTVNSKIVPMILTVVKRVPSPGGGNDASIEYRVDGNVTQIEVYRMDASGLFRAQSGVDGSNVITPPFQVLKFPLIFSSSWTWNGSIDMGGHITQATAEFSASSPESVITPAGTYKAVRVHVELKVDPKGGNLLVKNDYWFAPSVGMVQQTTRIGDTFVHGVMTSAHLQP